MLNLQQCKKNLQEYKEEFYSFLWAFVGGWAAFIIATIIILIKSDVKWTEIGSIWIGIMIAGFITGLGAGFPTLYSIYQQYSLRENLKILIYEDKKEQREQLVKNLEDAKYKVEAFGAREFNKAKNAVIADKFIKVAIVDQIILDEQDRILNAEQGLELVKAFSNCKRGDIRCIMLTGEPLDKASWIRGNRQLAENIDRYLRLDNVVDVIHKQLYQDGDQFTQALYTRIFNQIELLLKAGYLK